MSAAGGAADERTAAQQFQSERLESAQPQQVRALVLSRDHSPEREDEAARVIAAGGSIATTAGLALKREHTHMNHRWRLVRLPHEGELTVSFVERDSALL